MSQLPSVNGASSGEQAFGSNNALNDLDMGDFLNLMIAELQNQDPLNPLDNADLIAQIGQIREVGATEQLTETLGAVLLGQNISSATNLIGADVEAISDDDQRVTGVVDRVTISNGSPKLHIDEGPQVSLSDEPGNLGEGSYQYRVVWSDGEGKQFAIDPVATNGLEGGLIQLSEGDKSILISGLPVTASAKQIYRTDSTGTGDFRYAGTLADGKTSSFIDIQSDEELSDTVLSSNPTLIDNTTRSFTVSLKNVGEIRPPR